MEIYSRNQDTAFAYRELLAFVPDHGFQAEQFTVSKSSVLIT